jgi:bacterioferritin-associated ferredoxin
VSDRVFLCRCEDVTRAEIDHAIELGMRTIEELKRYTGLGTGPCQGKECLGGLATHLCARGLVEPHALEPFTARPPTEPVTFGALAAAAEPDDDTREPEPEPSEGSR